MPLDEFATEKESKPCSRDLTGARILCPHKTPENIRPVAGRECQCPDREWRGARRVARPLHGWSARWVLPAGCT